jgi:hypothetical protein
VRRRPDPDVPPLELLVFCGRPYATAQAWEAAFEAWHEARAAWAAGRGLRESEVPAFDTYTIDGRCPFDPAAL